MLPPLIVAHKERPYPLPRLSWRLIILQIDLLVCDWPPPPFDKAVVERPTPAVHAHLHPLGCQTSRKVETRALCPLITVENVRSRHLQSVVQRLQAKPDIPGDRDCPRQHIPTEPGHHGDQGDKPPMQPNRGDIRTPDLLHPRDRHAAE